MNPYQHNGSDKCPACSWHACGFKEYFAMMRRQANEQSKKLRK